MGEVREGYKMTELGEIPSEWNIVVLGDYLIKHEEKSEFTNQYPVLTSSRRGLFLQNEYYTRNVASEDNTGYNVVPRGYFTYRHMSDDLIFKFNINDRVDKGIVSTLYPVFTTKGLDDYFLKIKLNEGFEFRNFAIKQKQGGTRTYIYFSKLEKLKIILPPLKEQQKIASILSTVDEQIDETEQLIVKTKELKKGLMQQLLTKGIGHTEFKQTELGKIPVNWEIKLLKDIGTFVKGKGIAKKDLSDRGVPCILYGQLYTKYKDRIDNVISYTEIKMKNPIIGMKNDLLIPSSGETAIDIATASSLNVDNVYIGGDINLFTPIFGVNSNFLSLQINSVRKLELAKLAQGSSVYHLYASSLENFNVVLPPLEEQKKIASILSTVDEQIEAYEEEKAKYEELKKGLMQKLLTGQIRVKC